MIYFLIPILNESENIELLSKNLINCLPEENKYYVFVDDGSTDNSVAVLKKMAVSSSYTILGDGLNHGPGYAFNLGFEWILGHSHHDNDIVITLEADNTSDLTILPNMVSISYMGFDLVLASAYAQGGGFEQTTFLRKILSFGANMLLRFAYDIKVLTLSSFYRVYTITILKEVKKKYSSLIAEPGFISMIELLIKIIRTKGKIIEYPMTLHSSKRIGKTKIKVNKTTLRNLRLLIAGRNT